jgi:lysophospholipase L1-like esterase
MNHRSIRPESSEDVMNKLPYALDYMHKFNMHKWLGLLIRDDDLRSIARIYGVHPRALRAIEKRMRANVAGLAARLAQGRRTPAAEDANGAGSPEVPLRVLALGDSITSDREGYVNILNHSWKGSARTMIDCAISDDSTSNLIDRLCAAVLKQEFDWVVIFIGTNDCRQVDDPAHMARISLPEYQRNMEYLTGLFVESGRQVILVTLPPVDMRRYSEYFPASGYSYDKERIGATNRSLRELASRKGLRVADLAKAIEAESNDVLMSDGLHLNSTGQLLLSRLLLEIIP